MDSQSPNGSIIFSTVGRTNYGFDIFSLKSPLSFLNSPITEHRLTDGASVNFNGQFIDEDQTLVFVSERSGAPRIHLSRPSGIELIPISINTLFLDRPILRNNRLYYISAHQHSEKNFTSSSALYCSSTINGDNEVKRLTPEGSVDYSPSISKSGHMIAVASYGNRRWPTDEFHDLSTDIVVFPVSKPDTRTIVCRHGGWPTWSGDSTIYFHRKADDGWWSIFKLDLPDNLSNLVDEGNASIRITPPGVHCFTPAAAVASSGDHSKTSIIAIATRRPGKSYRHIEIFDVESQKFFPVTELINPTIHHYNPFFSPESTYLGYHRYRGESCSGETTIPYLDSVISPVNGLKMLRLNGFFPASSPSGEFIAFNPGFKGLEIVKSDGSKKWTLIKDRTSFCNSWSPAEPDVIYTSIGPIFESVKTTVQIARVSFSSLNVNNDETPVVIKVLTGEETGNNAFPSCSPDGKHVVFRSGRSGYKNLYVIDGINGETEGGEIRQLTNGAWIDTMPNWSPDGKLIAFSSNRHNPNDINCFSIYVVHPDGSGLRRIYVAGPEGSEEVDKERLNHVCFSKDSEWLLFTGNLSGVTAEPVSLPNQFQPYGDLYVVKLDGSGLRRLTCNGYENGTPAWHSSTMPMETTKGETERSVLVGEKLKGEFDDVLWMKC